MADFSRRDFVAGAVTAVACALTIRGVRASSALELSEGKAFDAGELAKLPKGFTDAHAKAHGAMIVRDDKDNVYAMSAVCTHQGGLLKVEGDHLLCSKHKAQFNTAGKPTLANKPAKQELSRYGVSVKDGHLWVDPDKIFLPGDFAKEGAWVKFEG